LDSDFKSAKITKDNKRLQISEFLGAEIVVVSTGIRPAILFYLFSKLPAFQRLEALKIQKFNIR